MELSTLKLNIQTKDFKDFYIFTGLEIEVLRRYILQIAKVSGSDIKNLDSITELAKFSHTRSVLKNKSILVIRESKEFIQDDSLRTKITQKNAFSDYILIFIYTTLDKRSKVYKNYQDYIVEFNLLNEDVLTKYILKDIDLSENNCKRLINICENSYGRILLEIDKIQNYACVKSISSNQAFTDLVAQNIIYIPPEDAVFDFVHAVLTNRKSQAFSLLKESYDSGEATMVLLANLYSSAKSLYQVQTVSSTSNICQSTGLTPFQVKLATSRKGIYKSTDLLRFMELTRNAEKGIKTGEIEETQAVPYILVNFW